MKKIYLVAAAALALAACDNNNDNPTVAAKITASIGESTVSRATDNKWGEGDCIGITSIVGGVAGPYINVKYITPKGDGFFEGDSLYFYRPMTLTAYYPYTGTTDTAPGTDGIITADTRADKQTDAKRPKIDFLWDSKTGVDKADFSASNPNVNFVFSHKMSKITFAFQSSPEVKDPITGLRIAGPAEVKYIINYKINDLVVDGTFDTNTGVCSVKTDASAEPLSIDVSDVKDDVDVPSVIVFPQTFSGGSTTLDIYANELNDPKNLQHYKCNLSFSNGKILPGYHYKYTIKVSKVGLIVGKMTVEPWVVENRFMTATIDGDNPFKQQQN